MIGFLLDTNVVSELVRERPEPNVLNWIDSTDETLLFISVLTLGELTKGVKILTIGKRRSQIESWIKNQLQPRFESRILPIDASVALRWGELSADARLKGTPLPVVDGLLAATAIENQLKLATRNTKDFERLPVSIINPWA